MASAALLAGLVLKKEIVHKISKQDITRGSVIYQEIKAEGKAQGTAKKAKEIAINLLNLGMVPAQIR